MVKAHDHPMSGRGEKALILFVSIVGVGTVIGYCIATAMDLMRRLKEALLDEQE